MSSESGLTLLELIITLSVITIATLVVGSALPVVREHQALQQARQQFTSYIRTAQTQALDEQRSDACLERMGDSLPLQKRCSDLGVYVEGNQLTVFADTQDNDQYDASDIVLNTANLPATIAAASPASILFEATPPNIRTYVNGLLVIPSAPAALTLISPNRAVSLTISAYGLVE